MYIEIEISSVQWLMIITLAVFGISVAYILV